MYQRPSLSSNLAFGLLSENLPGGSRSILDVLMRTVMDPRTQSLLTRCGRCVGVGLAAVLVSAMSTAESIAADSFSREWLEQEAAQLASQDYQASDAQLPDALANIGYDVYRTLRFRPEARLLADTGDGFSVDLLPPGFLYQDPVEINLIRSGEVVPIDFDLSRFDFGNLEEAARNAPHLFYTGFRIRYPINRPDVKDEVVVFQGASYFRAVGRGNHYGLSARGLAVNTAAPTGEEFPRFTRFWIEQPAPSAPNIKVHALLDSHSATGAYTFTITPGESATIDVDSVIFPRVDLENVGIAAQSSMFLFDASNRAGYDDYRVAVHDSGGLQMMTGSGSRLWRALANPGEVQVSAFADRNPTGFGLVQRNRGFSDYEDNEAQYQKRPSLWVKPLRDWGEGAVVLVEIPTETEYNDNIVALWQPAETLKAGERYAFSYRMYWSDLPPDSAPFARVVKTRSGQGGEAGTRRFVIDFAEGDPSLDPLPDAESSDGRVFNVTLQKLEATERTRVVFDLDPADAELIELGVQLQTTSGNWSEQWLYRWTPTP